MSKKQPTSFATVLYEIESDISKEIQTLEYEAANLTGPAGVLQVIGTSHKYTSVQGREKLARPAASLDLLEGACRALGVTECALVSTCNRVEIYYVSPHGTDHSAARSLFYDSDVDGASSLTDGIYHFVGEKAAEHLFGVACGLDSMILGEHEVLGQVKSALDQALQTGHAGPILKRAFAHAVKAGKRARRETGISSGIFSLGQCAARAAQEVVGDLRGKSMLVIGAGHIAKLAVRHMVALGAGPVYVFSRTHERAEDLAQMLGGKTITAKDMAHAVGQCDIVVGCAAAPHALVRCAEIQEAVAGRQNRPLVVIDLGVPRNVEASVGSLECVSLFNIDDLEAVVESNTESRKAEIERVREIIVEELSLLSRREAHTKAADAIAQLREKAERIRQECLNVASRQGLSERDLATVGYITDLLVRKLLHSPIVALREFAVGDGGEDGDITEAISRLFKFNNTTSEDPN